MVSLEGGCWKSAQWSNSLAAYPTARCVLRGRGGSDVALLPDLSPDGFDCWQRPAKVNRPQAKNGLSAIHLKFADFWSRHWGVPHSATLAVKYATAARRS